MPRWWSPVLAGTSFVCLACGEQVIVEIELSLDSIPDAKSLIVALENPGIVHLAAGPASSPEDVLPSPNPLFDGGPATLTVLADRRDLEELDLPDGSLKPSKETRIERTYQLGSLNTDWVFESKVIDGVAGPLHEVDAPNASLASLRLDPLSGQCEGRRVQVYFTGNLPIPQDFHSITLRSDGLLILVGDTGPMTRATRGVYATLYLPGIEKDKPLELDVREVDKASLLMIAGDPDVMLIGHAVTSTPTQHQLFIADRDGNPTEYFPVPEGLRPLVNGTFGIFPRLSGSFIIVGDGQTFELDPKTKTFQDRSTQYPPTMWSYVERGDVELAWSVTATREQGSLTFIEPKLLRRESGGRWFSEYVPDSGVTEKDSRPVAGVSISPDLGEFATLNTNVLRRVDGSWTPMPTNNATAALMSVQPVADKRMVVFGFAGTSLVYSDTWGWCNIVTGSSRSMNQGVVDPTGRFAAALDESNLSGTIPSWLNLLHFPVFP